MGITILRLPRVQEKTGLSRSSIYEKLSKNEFPRQFQLGARSIGFVESEIDKWIEDQIIASRRADYGRAKRGVVRQSSAAKRGGAQ